MPREEPHLHPSHLTPEERAAYSLGRRCFERGEVEEGLAQLGRLARSRPRFADVHYMMGLLYERQGDLRSAIRSLEQALQINPSYTEARLALAAVYEQQGDFARSQALAEGWSAPNAARGGALDGLTQAKLANLQAALGDAYREAGELGDAIEAYRKALSRCPQFQDVRHRLALTLREAGLPHQAIREFERILRARPAYLESAVQLGLTYFTLGRLRQAVEQWEAVLARDPSRADARMYLRMVRSRKERQPGAPASRPSAAAGEGDRAPQTSPRA